MAFYGNKFRSILDNLYKTKGQTKSGKRLGLRFTITCDPNLIEQIHKNPNFIRSAISRRMTEQYGAVDSMISQNEERSRIKRESMKSFLNNRVYKKVLKSTIDILIVSLKNNKKQEYVDIYPWIRRSLSKGIMEEFFGVKVDEELRKELLKVGSEILKYEEKLEKVAIMNFLNLPLWFRNLFSLKLKKRNKHFQKLTELIYERASVNPNGWFFKLKEMEKNGILSKKEVLGEIRSVYIGISTLATSLVWTIYRLSVEDQKHVENLIKSDSYSRYCYMESLRLYPPFPTISYEKESKCPFHMNETYVVSTYLTQRNPLYWKDSNLFDPLRFKNGMVDIKKGSYFPFGGGERYCPGTAMSMFIGPKILQNIFQNFSIEEMKVLSKGYDNKLFVEKNNSKHYIFDDGPAAIGRLSKQKIKNLVESQRDKKIVEENLSFFAKVSIKEN